MPGLFKEFFFHSFLLLSFFLLCFCRQYFDLSLFFFFCCSQVNCKLYSYHAKKIERRGVIVALSLLLSFLMFDKSILLQELLFIFILRYERKVVDPISGIPFFYITFWECWWSIVVEKSLKCCLAVCIIFTRDFFLSLQTLVMHRTMWEIYLRFSRAKIYWQMN